MTYSRATKHPQGKLLEIFVGARWGLSTLPHDRVVDVERSVRPPSLGEADGYLEIDYFIALDKNPGTMKITSFVFHNEFFLHCHPRAHKMTIEAHTGFRIDSICDHKCTSSAMRLFGC